MTRELFSMEKLTLTGDNDEIELYILESTRLGGQDYIFAADTPAGDGNCYILRDVSKPGSDTGIYEPVEDEHELDYLAGVFAELVEDIDIEF